jgi:hypothetical protein
MGTFARGGIGEGMGERPPSEISVLDESPPGELAVFPFHPKKELILLPGVLGCRGSGPMDNDRRLSISICRGGRLMGGCKAILETRRLVGGGEARTGIKGSLTRRLWREEGVPFVN